MRKKRIEKREMIRGNGNGLKQQYILSWNFLIESKNYIFLSLILFLVFAVFGFLFPFYFEDTILKLISELAEKTKDMNFFQLFLFIIENNIVTAFISVIFGILLGIIPFLISISNGYIIGFVAKKSVEIEGYSILFRLFPHGIFEFPAIVIAVALGLKLGMFVFAKKRKENLKHNLENSLRVFLYVILPLLIIAGLIETSLIVLLS